jgi:hypothetical protein
MPSLTPALAAGLLLAAIPVLTAHDLPAPAASAVLEATGAARTTAYKVKAEIERALPELLRPPGRPASPPPEAPPDPTALHRQVLDFLFNHPGAVGGSPERRSYSDRFQLFVLDLCESHHDIALEALAAAVGVPLPTLKDWLRGERPQVDSRQEPPLNLATVPNPAPARIQTVLTAWEAWDGDFLPFCEHVSFHLRIPFGRQKISDILEAHGVRIPNRRGRALDASANRQGFQTFFPRAQWVGDGAALKVTINGQTFTVNLELLVDADSGAFTGASIRPTEDAAAVTEAFADGLSTTGLAPLALLLDNKPSNHCEEVEEAIGDTLLLRSRPFVPSDKPHVEGAFGLFAQEAPAMILTATDLQSLAMQVAALVVTTWTRAANHRPRLDRQGKSRHLLYREASATPEQIAQAQAALLQRQRAEDKARQTRQRRQDPIVRALLDAAFERLGLEDPKRHLRVAIATWPLDAVIAAIAVFEGKKKTGTLPADVDARYLRGIVKNLAEEAEGWHIAEALLQERLAARDLALDHLNRHRETLEEHCAEPMVLLKFFVDKALTSARGIDRTFWLLASADLISEEQPADHKSLLRLAARRIHATSAVPHQQRLAATRFLFAKVVAFD